MRIGLFILLILMVSVDSLSQKKPDDYLKQFFGTFQSNTDKAIDDIYVTSEWSLRNRDSITELKKGIRELPENLGICYGFEFIAEQKCTERLVIYSYLARYDRQPLISQFMFYKPNNEWIFYKLTFGLDLDDDLEASIKEYIKNTLPSSKK